MILLLFLGSIITLEVILRHDRQRERKEKGRQAAVSRSTAMTAQNAPGPATDGLLSLLGAIREQGVGETPQIESQRAEKQTVDD